jgi:site-specific DNA-cytosine methylase
VDRSEGGLEPSAKGMKPLALDLCSGLGGWTHGLIAEGWEVIGYDIEDHRYGGDHYPAQLVIQDIRTLNGRQFRGKVSLVVASPPCTEFSYMSMPWTRAKQIASALRGKGEFPKGYKGSRTIAELTELFDACVRIGREAECPTIIENVRGAQAWVGRAKWAFGSFLLWGDVPALMPITSKRLSHKIQSPHLFLRDPKRANGKYAPNHSWEGTKADGSGWRENGCLVSHNRMVSNQAHRDAWFQDGAARHGSKSSSRKAASAAIAKIPLPLARWIARVYKPKTTHEPTQNHL